MILALDVGNSQTAAGLLEEGQVRRVLRFRTDPRRTADETRLWLQQLQSLLGLAGPMPPLAVSSVVPAVSDSFTALASEFDLFQVDHRSRRSFEIMLPHPETLGADRIVNAEACLRLYGAPAVVVDAGTATTFEVLDRQRRYLGGAIAPGLRISEAALYDRASKLAPVELKPFSRYIGRTTEEAIAVGVLAGHAAMIDGLLQKTLAELQEREVQLILTGGCSFLFRPYCATPFLFDPDLTLKGLSLLYEQNRR